MTLLTWIALLVASIALLLYSSDHFLNSASAIGKQFKIPPFVVGVVLIGFGTSLPELVSSLVAANSGASEIVSGNVIGSNIANMLLVFGIGLIFSKNLSISPEVTQHDIPFLAASIVFLTASLANGNFSLLEAIIFLVAMGIYLFHTLKTENGEEMEGGLKASGKEWFILLLSPIGIWLSAEIAIMSTLNIAEIANIGSEIIAVTAIALGTSLPEVAVSIRAAQKGEGDIIIGNITGSTIFNTFLVMGLPRLFSEIEIPESIISGSLPFLGLVTTLFIITLLVKRPSPYVGPFFILLYLFSIFNSFSLL